MVAPTIVYDLDGTLADTAGDLVATLNWLLGAGKASSRSRSKAPAFCSGLAPGSLIARGFAAVRKNLATRKRSSGCSRIISSITTPTSPIAPGFIPASTVKRFRWRWRTWAGAQARNLHQQDRSLGQAPDHQARRRRAFRFSSAARTHRVLASRTPRPLLKTIASLRAARAIARSWSGIPSPTSRPPARPACRSIAVDFGYSHVPVASLQPDRVISHFDQLEAACEALLRSPAS